MFGTASRSRGGGDDELRADSVGRVGVAAMSFSCSSSCLWGYYLLFEALADGQTPGKRAAPAARRSRRWLFRRLLRVGRAQSHAHRRHAAGVQLPRRHHQRRVHEIRQATRRHRRRHDRRARSARRATGARADAAGAAKPAHRVSALLTDDEFQLLERWADATECARAGAAAPARDAGRDAPAARASRPRDGERERRARSACSPTSSRRATQGAAARGATGASRERYAIVTTSSPRWIAFAASTRRGAATWAPRAR